MRCISFSVEKMPGNEAGNETRDGKNKNFARKNWIGKKDRKNF